MAADAPSAPHYTIYRRLPGLVLGFHGCEADTADKLLSGQIKHLTPSANAYDWLGSGVYFWENDPLRAWEFAQERHTQIAPGAHGHIKRPFVIGAVIDLGLCLNLTDRRALDEVRRAYEMLHRVSVTSGRPLPANKGQDFGARLRDRAVVEAVHETRQDNALAPYDTVRSPFPEGGKLYDGAGFQAKNHIQIAVRNLDRIKGYFRPIDSA
jgi:hypothetical protein